MNLSVVLGKLKRKGLYATLRTLCERYLFIHCRLLWLQREEAMPQPATLASMALLPDHPGAAAGLSQALRPSPHGDG